MSDRRQPFRVGIVQEQFGDSVEGNIALLENRIEVQIGRAHV